MTCQTDPAAPRPFNDPFDDDKLHEECGVFGVIGLADAANFVALGLHALQHRGQEAGGIVSHHPETGFNSVRRFGYVRDNFTEESLMKTLPGPLSIGHVRYSTSGSKGQTAIRDVQPFFGEFSMGGAAVAHNGNLTNAVALRRELIARGAIFQSSSDSECIIHLMARSMGRTIPDRMEEALRKVEGAFSIVAMTRTKLIGCRDPLGVRPLVLGRVADGYALSSETCALDIIGAEFVREINPGEMVVITGKGGESRYPFRPAKPRFCIFEHVYFSRPDSILGGRSVYETRHQIGVELAREAPVDADLVCPVPDSGTPAAIGFAQESGIPFEMGIVRNQYVGRTFIEPTEQIRNMGVRLKLNVNRALMRGKRVILVDGEPVGAINRLPAAGETRSNMHVGGRPEPCALTERDREICAEIGPKLRDHGQVFVGIDVIGTYLTEINVTSPTGIQELERFDGVNVAQRIWEETEARLI